MLFEPQLEQPRGRQRLEARYRHKAANIRARDGIAVDLEPVGVEAQPIPKAELLHVRVDVEFENALVLAAIVQAAPIVERLGVVSAANVDACIVQAGDRASGDMIDDVQLAVPVGDEIVPLKGHFAIGAGRGRHGDKSQKAESGAAKAFADV